MMSTPSDDRRTARVDRRHLLLAGAGAAGTWALAGCDVTSTEPDRDQGPGSTASAGGTGREAPMLEQKVRAGSLPHVRERLPKNPLVVEPLTDPGRYGGQWNSVLSGSADTAWLGRTVGYEYLLRWDLAFTKVMPNVAQSVELGEGGEQVTLTLRPGMRWSDGTPFTADDLVFAYDDVVMNKDLTPTPSGSYVSGNKPGRLEKIDDHTIRFTFSPPNGLFLQYLGSPFNHTLLTQFPRHYLKKFHKKYKPDVAELAKKEHQPSWIELFNAKADPWQNPDLSRLHAWVPTTALGKGQRIIFERNPYYWKVDPQGRQLPYLDRVVFEIIEDPEAILLKAGNGELDMDDRHVVAQRDRPVLGRNRKRGNFRFLEETPTNSVGMVLALNLTAKDPAKRAVFQNRDFRVALSHAINRKEIIDTAYQRQGEPSQVAPRQGSPFYDEEMTKQYTEHDPRKANELLDRAGYSERNGSGVRLAPGGAPISFAVDVVADDVQKVDALQLIKGYFKEVGVDLQVKAEDRSLFETRREANDHEASTWSAEGGGALEPPIRTDWWFPSASESQNYARRWMEWYESNGEAGEKPPDEVRRQMAMYNDKVKTEVDEDARIEGMRQVLKISKSFFYHIGISLDPPLFAIVSNDFHNVPKKMIQSFVQNTPGPSNPEQYFTTRES